MNDNYFSREGITKLEEIAGKDNTGKKVHILGVCGTAMGQLAVLLKNLGYTVSGSDREFYDPIATLLRDNNINTTKVSETSSIPKEVDIVVIGNSISKDRSPEIKDIVARKLPYTIFPDIVNSLLVKGRHPIVVTGTHGKSTTTSFLATALVKLKKNPGFFIGAKVAGLDTSLVKGAGEYTVLEGDEYDSAFFAKFPKFHFYGPKTLIVTSLEFDHADIYDSLEDIKHEFRELVSNLDEDATLIVCADYPALRSELKVWKEVSKARILTYGFGRAVAKLPHTKVVYPDITGEGLRINRYDGLDMLLSNSLFGKHNQLNFTAAFLALTENGVDLVEAASALGSFKGLTRRLEKILDSDKLTVYEDFAHHPTAVKSCINALKESEPNKKLVALFEPRSNTSRRKFFQKEYTEAFLEADEVYIKNVVVRHNDSEDDILNVKKICSDLNKKGVQAKSVNSFTEVVDDFTSILNIDSNRNNAKLPANVVVMSNGSIDEFREKVKNLG